MASPLNTIPEAIAALQRGEFIIVLDPAERENEGDLVLAAQFVNSEKVAFMLKHTSGILCVPMTKKRLEELQLPRMVSKNTDAFNTPFTISVDAKAGISSGVSALDRATTIQRLTAKETKPDDLVRPGHVFPLQAADGGVLQRVGHTEASVDLCKLADIYPAAVIAELMDERGVVLKGDALFAFAREHGMVVVTIADLIYYRRQRELLVDRGEQTSLPTSYGLFDVIPYTEKLSGAVHLAFVHGFVEGDEPVTVRMHSECLTGDVFSSQRCDCGAQLHKALEMIAERGKGVLLYLRQEGRGIGLLEKLRTYSLQDKGYDTVDANVMLGYQPDMREYGIGAQILRDLGLKNIILLTNNPRKITGLEMYGLKIVGHEKLLIPPGENNFHYLKTKQEKLGHLLDL